MNGRFESAPPRLRPARFPRASARNLPRNRSSGSSVCARGGVPRAGVARARHPGRARLEAAAALTWAAGVALSALGFLSLARILRRVSRPCGPRLRRGDLSLALHGRIVPRAVAGGFLALGAASVLSETSTPFRRGGLGGVLWAFGACLKPVLWPTAAVLVLAAALAERRQSGSRRGLSVGVLTGLAAVALLFAAVNVARTGSPFDVGYGPQSFLFVQNPLPGLFGLTVSPGRGLLFFAPVVVASLLAARRLSGPAALVCLATPALLVLTVSRWLFWDGSTCWGPRLVLGVLPLLAAPAVLRPRWAVPLLAAGALLNLPGVLVSSGAWISYAELLTPRPGVTWPPHGSERVSSVPSLSPLYGHVWLLAQRGGRPRLPAPWHGEATATGALPRPADFVSPAWLRAAVGLPAIRPMLPRLLVRSAVGWAVRGRIADALNLAEEAARLAPGDRDIREVAASLRAAAAPEGARP